MSGQRGLQFAAQLAQGLQFAIGCLQRRPEQGHQIARALIHINLPTSDDDFPEHVLHRPEHQ